MAFQITSISYEDYSGLPHSEEGDSVPTLYDVESLGLTYFDGRVEAAVSCGKDVSGTVLNIGTWDSDFPENGHSRAALEWLRCQFDRIVVHSAGEIDEEGVADIPTLFWLHMHGKGLVDTILLDDGTQITPDGYDASALRP